jgi:hypothetical protein
MAKEGSPPQTAEQIEIDLRQPGLAAFLAWLWPGAGHIYQRRYAKGIIFMVFILTPFFYGLTLGQGHVVYASWRPNDRRWQYICQVGIGLPALPALVQRQRMKERKKLWFDGFMAPPEEVHPEHHDQLAEWHEELCFKFELGTLYTMIAGLLNVLAIYDAYAGPFVASSDKDEDKKRRDGDPAPD